MKNTETGSLLENAEGYYFNKQYDKALDVYKALIEIEPENYKHYYNSALMYDITGDTDFAISFYDKALSLNNNHIRSINNMGLIYYRLSDIKKAENLFNTAIAKYPADAEAYSNLGIIERDRGDYKLALAYFIKANRLDKNFFWNLFNMAETYKLLNNKEKAIEYYNLCLEKKPDFEPAKLALKLI